MPSKRLFFVLTGFVGYNITPRPAKLLNLERKSYPKVPSGASGATSFNGQKECVKDIRVCSIILREGRLGRARWGDEGK